MNESHASYSCLFMLVFFMDELRLWTRYEILGDWLNYDAKMRRVHWSLAESHPQPATHEALAIASGVALSTVKDKVAYMRAQGVIERGKGGWVFSDVGYSWFQRFHAEMLRVAYGGVYFSKCLLDEIISIQDADKINFSQLRSHAFFPVIDIDPGQKAGFRP